MHKSRKTLHVLAILMLTIMLPTIIFNSISTKAKASSAIISDTSVVLGVGDTKNLQIKGATGNVSWASNNRTIASVTYGGKVTAKKIGTATITAFVDGERLTCKVSVIKPVRLNHSWTTLSIGSTLDLDITGSDDMVTWTASKPDIASVSHNGVVTAKAEGYSKITASVEGRRFSIVITVQEDIVDENLIRLNHSWTTLDKRETLDLDITGTDSQVTWSSSKPDIASVTNSGVVTAKTEGFAKITASVDGRRFSIVITVE